MNTLTNPTFWIGISIGAFLGLGWIWLVVRTADRCERFWRRPAQPYVTGADLLRRQWATERDDDFFKYDNGTFDRYAYEGDPECDTRGQWIEEQS